MGGEPRQLHVAFFPFMAAGHTIPILDIASLFAARNVKTTILTTPLNAPNITKSLCNQQNIDIEVVLFPSEEAGLPKGIENMANVTCNEMAFQFISSMRFFKEALEEFLEKKRPDCLVADAFFLFASDMAANFGIPRLVFHGGSFIMTCVTQALKKYKPQNQVLLDDEPFIVVPHLPHEVKLAKSEIPSIESENNDQENDFRKLFAATEEAELKSFGVIFNSFYELEPDYVDYYRKVLERRAWHIGPVSLCKGRDNEDANEVECLKWLNSKEPKSVIYVCFGSMAKFLASQLKEIAMALEALGQHFIWVLNKRNQVEIENEEEWMPEGFVKRMQERGLIVRGWAPQVMILRNQAIGGFLTHCGWNSILEGVSAGVPMATWPLFGDQFFNEKLVTDVLRIGVQVGSKQPASLGAVAILKWEKIKVALDHLLVGEEALEMRGRANKLKEMAWKAMEEGGSSLSDLSALIQELSCYQTSHCGEAHTVN